MGTQLLSPNFFPGMALDNDMGHTVNVNDIKCKLDEMKIINNDNSNSNNENNANDNNHNNNHYR